MRDATEISNPYYFAIDLLRPPCCDLHGEK
jgi:hypothetical protein